MNVLEVRPHKGRWDLIFWRSGEDVEKNLGNYRWQFEAWLVARHRAKELVKDGVFTSVQVIVKGKDGTPKRHDTYGYDPKKSKG